MSSSPIALASASVPGHGHSVPQAARLSGPSSSAFGALVSYWHDLGASTWAGVRGAGHAVAHYPYAGASRQIWRTSWLRAPQHSFQLVAYSEGPYAEHLKRKPIMRALLDADYKTQLIGRWGVQVGLGIAYGVSALILGMSGSMGASQGMLAADLVRGLELLLHQGSSLWRGRNNDRTRLQRENAERDLQPSERTRQLSIPRHRFVCALDTAWAAEVLLSGALIGVALCRRAAFMSVRNLILVLAVIRAARVVSSQAQFAQFDSLRETVRSKETRQIFTQNQNYLRNLEQVVGFGINYAVGVGVQALPALVPCPALVPVFVGLLGVGVAVSFLSKQPARRYYKERTDVVRPLSGANTPATRPHED